MNTLSQVSAFGNDATALEKTLRLAQAIAQIGASLQESPQAAAPYALARGQFNLARRFFRLHKWIDNFSAASTAMTSSKPSIPKILESAKFTFLGLYFFMEMLTITDLMGLTSSENGPWLVVESNRFWLYGLVCSLCLTIWEGVIVGGGASAAAKTKGKKGSEKGGREGEVSSTTKARKIPYKAILIDWFDMSIPGNVVGYMDFAPLTVGIAMAISTVLQLTNLWATVQARASAPAAATASKKKQ